MSVTITDGVPVGEAFLVTVAELKRRLGVTHASDDTLIAELIEEAQETLESEIGRLIVAAQITQSVRVRGNVRAIQLRNWPLDQAEDVTVEFSADDVTFETFTDVEVDYANGLLVYPGMDVVGSQRGFPLGLYEIEYTGGMSASAHWGQHESELKRAITLLAVDSFANRNPSATGESDGTMSVSRSPLTMNAAGGYPLAVKRCIDRHRSPL